MMERRLFTKSFLLAIFLVNIQEFCVAYTPPTATVERLHPTGLRMSIPDEPGISLVAFHIKINDHFDGLEAGHIAKDILNPRNGRWTYEDGHTRLNSGDTVHYWIHVDYRGEGYNLVNQATRV
jgi:hypothetical protein